jgi:hypothetical protein
MLRYPMHDFAKRVDDTVTRAMTILQRRNASPRSGIRQGLFPNLSFKVWMTSSSSLTAAASIFVGLGYALRGVPQAVLDNHFTGLPDKHQPDPLKKAPPMVPPAQLRTLALLGRGAATRRYYPKRPVITRGSTRRLLSPSPRPCIRCS